MSVLTDLIQSVRSLGRRNRDFTNVAKALEALSQNSGGGKFGKAGEDNIGAEPRIFERRGEDFFVIDNDNDWYSYFGAYGNDGSCEMYAQDPNVSNKWGDLMVTPDEINIGVGAGSNIRFYGIGNDANPNAIYCVDNSGNFLRKIGILDLKTLLGIGGGAASTPYSVFNIAGQGAHVGNMNSSMDTQLLPRDTIKRFRYTLFLQKSNDAAASNFFIGLRDFVNNGYPQFGYYTLTYKFTTATGAKHVVNINMAGMNTLNECPAAWISGQLSLTIEGVLKTPAAQDFWLGLYLDSNTGSGDYTEILQGSYLELF